MFWRPYDGLRHAVSADLLPKAGQVRDALCGASIAVLDTELCDWIAPTCETCWEAAAELRDRAANVSTSD